MQYFEIMMGSMIMNNLTALKTGSIIFDSIIIILIILGSCIFSDHKSKTLIKEFVFNIFYGKKKEKKITGFKLGKFFLKIWWKVSRRVPLGDKGRGRQRRITPIATKFTTMQVKVPAIPQESRKASPMTGPIPIITNPGRPK